MSDQWSVANLKEKYNYEQKKEYDGRITGEMVKSTTYELRKGYVTLYCNRSHWGYTSVRLVEVVLQPRSPYIVYGPDGNVCDYDYPEMPDETRALLECAGPFIVAERS